MHGLVGTTLYLHAEFFFTCSPELSNKIEVLIAHDISVFFLDPDDLAFLMNHLKPIASHWRALGLQLGMLYGELSTIADTPLLIPGGPVAFLQEVLTKWLDRAPPFPTLSKLCGALRSHAVDQSRIAFELEQQYQTQKTGLLTTCLEPVSYSGV